MKSTTSNNSKVYLFAGTIILAIAGYFGYKYWRNKHPKQETPPPPPPPVPPVVTDGQNSGGNSSSNSVPIAENPFKTSAELMNFQKYVIDVRKDTKIMSPYTADGKWGQRSANAFAKYGKDYLASSQNATQGGTQVYADLEKDITMIISYCSGAKADASYLRATGLKYPAFVQNWAEAVRKRKVNTTLGTTFIFANQIYETYRGNKVANTLLLNKTAIKKDGTTYAFQKPDRYSSSSNTSSSAKEIGIVNSYFYNKAQDILFVYIPNGTFYSWNPISAIEKFT